MSHTHDPATSSTTEFAMLAHNAHAPGERDCALMALLVDSLLYRSAWLRDPAFDPDAVYCARGGTDRFLDPAGKGS